MLSPYTPPGRQREPGHADIPRVLFVPQGIDLSEVATASLRRCRGKAVRRKRLDEAVLQGRRDEAALILHKIITGSVFCDHDDRWTPLSRDQGVFLCGGNNRVWQGLRRALLDGGIIECDGDCKVGVKCYNYRLTATWEERDISRYRPSDPGVTARLAEIYRRNRGRSSKSRPPV